MSRREIEALVTALKGCGPDSDTHENCVRAVAEQLHAINPRFEVERFLKDCGVQS